MPTYRASNGTTLNNQLGTTNNVTTESFINLGAGTTFVTLAQTPLVVEEVERNGIELLNTEYTLAGNVLTLITPIGSSTGAVNGEDIVVTYQY